MDNISGLVLEVVTRTERLQSSRILSKGWDSRDVGKSGRGGLGRTVILRRKQEPGYSGSIAGAGHGGQEISRRSRKKWGKEEFRKKEKERHIHTLMN